MWELVRIEPLVDRLVDAGARTAEIVTAVDARLADAAARGAVGAKTVLAYRTGLAVDPDANLAAADRSLDSPLPVRQRGKAMRDLLFRHVLGTCNELGLPLQVHTGFGDSDLRLAGANPLLLDEVLRTPEAAGAKRCSRQHSSRLLWRPRIGNPRDVFDRILALGVVPVGDAHPEQSLLCLLCNIRRDMIRT